MPTEDGLLHLWSEVFREEGALFVLMYVLWTV